MHTKDAIKFALTVSNGAVLSVIDEMSGAATTFPTPNGGCHPLWVLGHLTLIEGMIPAVLFGDKNPATEWQQFFGESSEPVADAKAFATYGQSFLVLALHQTMHRGNVTDARRAAGRTALATRAAT